MPNPFDSFITKAWPHRHRVELHVAEIHGGVPRNPDVVRSWLRAKAGWTDEQQIEAEVARIFQADPTQTDEEVAGQATAKLADQHVNGFKRDDQGLYIEGRQLKAGIKEAASIARATNKLAPKWGATNKGVHAFVAEHVVVVEDRLYLGRTEHDEVHTRFVSTWRGTGDHRRRRGGLGFDAKIAATVVTSTTSSPCRGNMGNDLAHRSGTRNRGPADPARIRAPLAPSPHGTPSSDRPYYSFRKAGRPVIYVTTRRGGVHLAGDTLAANTLCGRSIGRKGYRRCEDTDDTEYASCPTCIARVRPWHITGEHVLHGNWRVRV